MPNYYEDLLRNIIPYPKHHPGTFGVELELEGRGWVAVAGWKGKAENSLRNGGWEYILPSPLSLKDLEASLKTLNDYFKAYGVELTPSFRTSTHFHFNVQNHSIHTIVRAAVVWTLLEDYLLSLLPPARRGNLFCLSSRDTGNMADHVHRQVTQARHYYGGGFHDRGKYAAFNDKHINDFGSVEFRVFPEAHKNNQIEVKKILEWAELIQEVMTYCQNWRIEKVLRMVDEARSMPEIFLRRFFLKIEGDPGLVSESAPEAHEVALAIAKAEKAEDRDDPIRAAKERMRNIDPAWDDDDPPEEEFPQEYPEEDEDEPDGPF